MKILNWTLLIIAIIAWTLFAVVANAECTLNKGDELVEQVTEIKKTDMPAHLEGATIIVRLKDGRESVVPAEKYKVVPRQQQFIVTKTSRTSALVCVDEKDRNRVSLLGGKGPKGGLDVNRSGDTVTVESQYGAVGGLQYQRLITEDISVGGQVQTNDSIMLNIGLDF